MSPLTVQSRSSSSCTIIADITNRVIETGQFHKKKIQKTLSDAINIEVVSNTLLPITPLLL
jgi:hypothetical protein